MPHHPQLAAVHDYDSEMGESPRPSAIARRKKPSSNRNPGMTKQQREPTPSDSGYSSHASGPANPDPSQAQALVRHSSAAQTMSKTSKQPVMLRRDSARGQQAQCSDPNCRDPNCLSVADLSLTTSLPPQPVPSHQPGYPLTSEAQYIQEGQRLQSYYSSPMAAPMQSPVPQVVSHTMPPPQTMPQAIPRPRTGSHTRQRPASIYGNGNVSYGSSFDDTQRGPPPSASAYYVNTPYDPYPQSAVYHSSTPPDPTSFPSHWQGPGSYTSTTSSMVSGQYPGAGLPTMYSARQGNPALPGLIVPKIPAYQTISRVPSARSDRATPRSVPAPEIREPECESDDSDMFEEVTYALDGGRGSQDVVLARTRRRPSMHTKSHTTPNMIPHSGEAVARRRHSLRQSFVSDSDFDYPSDHMDSDQTRRAIVSTKDANRSGRRPSVSTTASRPKATTFADEPDYIIEDRERRRREYKAHKQADTLRLINRPRVIDPTEELDEKKRQIAAYQREMSGETHELTAENIHDIQKQKRRSGSHLTGARTHKSSGSGSRMSRPNDGGIRIESSGTVLHVYGSAQIEMRHSEDGGPAHLVVNSASGHDSGYHGSSRSSESRYARSRAGVSEAGRARRPRQIIYETHEDEYEVPL